MICIFKFSILYTLLFGIPGGMKQGKISLKFDKGAYFAAMAGQDLTEINTIMGSLEESSIPEKSAYEGALLMKKAGLQSKAKDKLSLFKSGRTKLEEAIKNDPGNVE